ncbi:MAG: phosphoenolpyruvate synthase, partial [Bacteroidales bacterium]|nr:phosphoenolpyruvate synthase [Bacteroidales bacterium]
MKRRIRRILLVCNNYDSYSLEEDGHIESLIAADYLELNLSNPPAIVRVETTVQALELLEAGEKFDLAITMYNVGELDVFSFSHKAKECNPEMPVVLLCGYAKEIFRKIAEADKSCIDHVFCWNNSTDVIIAIIKLIEDDMNADHDILDYGVQAILLVEDSVRYYSTYLPALYSIILHQNASAVRDALNEQQQKARKRARPKILMATNYDDAVALYEKYKNNLLGVISDVGFVLHKGDLSKNEKLDAGVDLCKRIREDNPKMPFLMQSSQESIRKVAESLGVGFLQKSSKTLTYELEEYIGKHFGFGDFVVTDPQTGAEIARAHDLAEFEQVMKTVPAEYFNIFSASNYLSKWLYARGLFQIGQVVRGFTVEGFASIEENRQKVVDLVHDFRIAQGLGVVAKFNPDAYNDTIWFASLGEGSLGGKARGLAFLNHILQKYNLYNEFEGVRLRVPKTLVVMTDYFEKFIIENGLQYVINSDLSDEEILSKFVASRLPYELIKALKIFIRNTNKPLAIRSSSKLEDSYYQPFAGVYSTYMIPHTENEDQQLRLLTKAIKSVYASVYFASSRRYITAAANVISEEKMAIVIQEICGSEQDGYYFPTISGVARSVNFYPVGSEKSEDGIAKIAYGLGKAVVDGEQVLRFSPRQPKKVLQISTPENTVSDTQKSMFALSLKPDSFKTSVDDAVNLERIPLAECPKFASFAKVGSTWDRENMRIVDSTFPEGPKFITFASVLKYGLFPLAKIITRLLDIAKEEMKCDVEIEFA